MNEMSDTLRSQIKIADEHYKSIPADLRRIYENEYSVASAAYRHSDRQRTVSGEIPLNGSVRGRKSKDAAS